MKTFFCRKLPNPIPLVVFFISLISFKGYLVHAEYLFEDLQMDTTTKSEEDELVIPTNPFELVERIRKYNSMNDATKPSDAIDVALKSFNNLDNKKEI